MKKIEIIGTDPAKMIREALEQENLNQKDLAEKMGAVRQNVSQALNRSRVSIRFDTFRKMAEALGYEIVLRKNRKNLYFKK
ncbi:MAG: helix-turn-helix transcriptional regulator [Lachnospiraceae bacterium]|nr:helix-turn-helix transcriptional regulator [Lachnospiraceae bacterium]